MDKVIENLSNKILDKIDVDEQEYTIVAYGIHEAILIILNILTVAILSLLWGETLFGVLFFVWFVILRPFAGGYHADTELSCYLISVAVLNFVLACKKYLLFLIPQYLLLWFITAIIIFALAPVGNTSNLLKKEEIKRYGKNTRIIVMVFSFIMLVGMVLRAEAIYSSIVYSQFLVSAALLGGKLKYGGSVGGKTY